MSLSIGSSRPLYASWAQDYFPADLPLEWRWVYYANDYPVVMFDDRIWLQDIELNEFDWPDSLQLVFEISSASPQQADRLDQILQLSTNNHQVVLLSADANVCKSLTHSGFQCMQWNKIATGEYKALGATGDPTIWSLRDEGGDLRQIRMKLEQYSLDEGESWVFLDSPPARLEQIKLMLDLMGIRG